MPLENVPHAVDAANTHTPVEEAMSMTSGCSTCFKSMTSGCAMFYKKIMVRINVLCAFIF